MKQTKPNQVKITQADKKDLERWAAADGFQRGVFFDTSGKARIDRVSATSQHCWLFKTKSGKPFTW